MHKDLSVGRRWGGKKLNNFEELREVQNKLKEAVKRLEDAVYIAPSPKDENFFSHSYFLFKVLSNLWAISLTAQGEQVSLSLSSD